MSIAKYSPTAEDSVVKPDIKEYETATIDGSIVPISSLIQFVEGSKWEVNYYSQMLGNDDGVENLDSFLPDILQQYTEIRDFILHVTTPLSDEVYTDLQSMTAVGVATYYNIIPPNIGDVFTAILLDNRIGLFSINDVERQSIVKESTYEVSYKIISILTINDAKFLDLKEKTIRTYYYDSDNYFNNISPLLTAIEYNTKISLVDKYKDVVDLYLGAMLDTESNMFIIPGQDHRIYDHPLAEFLFKILRLTDNEKIKHISRHTLRDKFLKQINIWDVLIEQDIELLNHCNRKLVPTSLAGLTTNTDFRILVYKGFDYCVYPSEPDESTDSTPDAITRNTIPLIATGANIKNIAVSFVNEDLGLFTIPLVDTLTTYLFTPEFYDQGSNLTVLESLVLSYLRKESINMDMLTRVMGSFRLWNRLEQFYYCPVLMLLIRYSHESRVSHI